MSDRTTSATLGAAQRENTAREKVQALLASAEGRREHFSRLLPDDISWEAFKDTFKIAVQNNPALLDADRDSLWIALQKAALDGLRPDGREGALVIFSDVKYDENGEVIAEEKKPGAKQKLVVWMPMIAGLIKLARATGNVKTLRSIPIYAGETFEMRDENGQQSYLHQRILAKDFADGDEHIVGFYAVINFADGSWDMEVMSRNQVARVRAVSRAKSEHAPWQKWYPEMGKKTVMRRLLKRQDRARVTRAADAIDRDETMTVEHVDPDAGASAPPKAGPSKQLAQPTPAIDIGLNKPDKMEAEDPADKSLGKKQPLPPPADTEPKKPSKPAEPPAWEHWAVDEIGEPVDPQGNGDGLVFHAPTQFAHWFLETAEKTANIEALMENNADAIADSRSTPEAFQIINRAYTDATKRLLPAAELAAGSSPPGTDAAMPVPLLPSGKPHWPNYAANAAVALAALNAPIDVIAWEQANTPTFDGKAIHAKVLAHISARMEALGVKQGPAPDRDRLRADDFLREIAACKIHRELEAWSASAVVATTMMRWKTEESPLFREVADASNAKMLDMKSKLA